MTRLQAMLLLGVGLALFTLASVLAFQYDNWAYSNNALVHRRDSRSETFTLVRIRRSRWLPGEDAIHLEITSEHFQRLRPQTSVIGGRAGGVHSSAELAVTTSYVFNKYRSYLGD